jgi:hypothetical protein
MAWVIWQDDAHVNTGHSWRSLLADNFYNHHITHLPLHLILNQFDLHHECHDHVSKKSS